MQLLLWDVASSTERYIPDGMSVSKYFHLYIQSIMFIFLSIIFTCLFQISSQIKMAANVFILQYKHIILPFVSVFRFAVNEALHYDILNGRII